MRARVNVILFGGYLTTIDARFDPRVINIDSLGYKLLVKLFGRLFL